MLRGTMALFWLVALGAALRAPPGPARCTHKPALANRRSALQVALALPAALLLQPPLNAQAKCICRSVGDCTCTEDAPNAAAPKGRVRADAAGRDAVEAIRDREAFMQSLNEPVVQATRTKAPPRPPAAPRAPPPPPPQYEAGGAARKIESKKGLESQEFGEIDANSAKAR